jgi:hypothetical protein
MISYLTKKIPVESKFIGCKRNDLNSISSCSKLLLSLGSRIALWNKNSLSLSNTVHPYEIRSTNKHLVMCLDQQN